MYRDRFILNRVDLQSYFAGNPKSSQLAFDDLGNVAPLKNFIDTNIQNFSIPTNDFSKKIEIKDLYPKNDEDEVIARGYVFCGNTNNAFPNLLEELYTRHTAHKRMCSDTISICNSFGYKIKNKNGESVSQSEEADFYSILNEKGFYSIKEGVLRELCVQGNVFLRQKYQSINGRYEMTQVNTLTLPNTRLGFPTYTRDGAEFFYALHTNTISAFTKQFEKKCTPVYLNKVNKNLFIKKEFSRTANFYFTFLANNLIKNTSLYALQQGKPADYYGFKKQLFDYLVKLDEGQPNELVYHLHLKKPNTCFYALPYYFTENFGSILDAYNESLRIAKTQVSNLIAANYVAQVVSKEYDNDPSSDAYKRQAELDTEFLNKRIKQEGAISLSFIGLSQAQQEFRSATEGNFIITEIPAPNTSIDIFKDLSDRTINECAIAHGAPRELYLQESKGITSQAETIATKIEQFLQNVCMPIVQAWTDYLTLTLQSEFSKEWVVSPLKPRNDTLLLTNKILPYLSNPIIADVLRLSQEDIKNEITNNNTKSPTI